MVKIALDGGHGGFGVTPGKRTPTGEYEWTFNNKVLLACQERLRQYHNVQILRLDDPSGKTDVTLEMRTDKANAWKADVLVSIHHNAYLSKWGGHGGVETLVYPTASKASFDLARIVQPRIVRAMGLRNRGVKTKDLHMLRESRMPAILTEGGFMDSTTDIGALRDDNKLNEQGYAIADGLAEYFNLQHINPATSAQQTEKAVDDLSGVFNPGSAAIMQSAKKVLERMSKSENQSISKDWISKLDKRELTTDEAIGLLFVALDRNQIELK